VKKVTHNNRPFAWCLAHVCALAAVFIVAFAGGVIANLVGGSEAVNELRTLTLLAQLSSVVLYVASAFSLKGALEERPIDIPLSGVMTFLFAPIYFQYHLFDYSVEGKVGEQLSGFAEPEIAVAPVAVVQASQVPPQA
jgi:hypothetical protein